MLPRPATPNPQPRPSTTINSGRHQPVPTESQPRAADLTWTKRWTDVPRREGSRKEDSAIIRLGYGMSDPYSDISSTEDEMLYHFILNKQGSD